MQGDSWKFIKVGISGVVENLYQNGRGHSFETGTQLYAVESFHCLYLVCLLAEDTMLPMGNA